MSKYFKPDEYECTCGCGLKRIDPNFLIIMDRIREEFRKPIYVNSGCRCGDRNEAIGGARQSPHMVWDDGFTHAFDIRCTASGDRFKLVSLALKHGITRIGMGETFIHLDNADHLDNDIHIPNLMWDYY